MSAADYAEHCVHGFINDISTARLVQIYCTVALTSYFSSCPNLCLYWFLLEPWHSAKWVSVPNLMHIMLNAAAMLLYWWCLYKLTGLSLVFLLGILRFTGGTQQFWKKVTLLLHCYSLQRLSSNCILYFIFIQKVFSKNILKVFITCNDILSIQYWCLYTYMVLLHTFPWHCYTIYFHPKSCLFFAKICTDDGRVWLLCEVFSSTSQRFSVWLRSGLCGYHKCVKMVSHAP